MTDGELVRRTRDGDTAARETLVRRWSPHVLATCRARTRHHHAAEDLAQEALIRGLTNLHQLGHPEKFGPWLRGIAVHVCLDWHRQQSRRSAVNASAATNDDANLDHFIADETNDIETAEQREQLREAMRGLSDDLRETLYHFYYDDMTYDQIADLLGVSRATVNARLAKARLQVARRLPELATSPSETHR